MNMCAQTYSLPNVLAFIYQTQVVTGLAIRRSSEGDGREGRLNVRFDNYKEPGHNRHQCPRDQEHGPEFTVKSAFVTS